MTDRARRHAVLDGTARSKGLRASAIVAVVAMAIFLWWATHYAAIVEWLGEWQFSFFGRYFPSLTATLAVAIIALPIAAIVGVYRRNRRRRAVRDGELSALDRVTIAHAGALRGRIFFLVIAGGAVLVALIALLAILAEPTDEGAVATITGREIAPAEGPARFATGRTLGQVGRLEERVGLFVRTTYVAPVRPIGARTGAVRYFTEVERLAGPDPRFVPIRQGILRAHGLPGELVNLYRGTGLVTIERPYLLVRDADWLRWRPIVLAGQLLLLALAAALAAFLLRRQARRLDKFRTGAEQA